MSAALGKSVGNEVQMTDKEITGASATEPITTNELEVSDPRKQDVKKDIKKDADDIIGSNKLVDAMISKLEPEKPKSEVSEHAHPVASSSMRPHSVTQGPIPRNVELAAKLPVDERQGEQVLDKPTEGLPKLSPTLRMAEHEIRSQQHALAEQYSKLAHSFTRSLEKRVSLTLKKLEQIENKDKKGRKGTLRGRGQEEEALVEPEKPPLKRFADNPEIEHLGKLLSYQISTIQANSRGEALNIWRDFSRQKIDLRESMGMDKQHKIIKLMREREVPPLSKATDIPVLDWISSNLDTVHLLRTQKPLNMVEPEDAAQDVRHIREQNISGVELSNREPSSESESEGEDGQVPIITLPNEHTGTQKVVPAVSEHNASQAFRVNELNQVDSAHLAFPPAKRSKRNVPVVPVVPVAPAMPEVPNLTANPDMTPIRERIQGAANVDAIGSSNVVVEQKQQPSDNLSIPAQIPNTIANHAPPSLSQENEDEKIGIRSLAPIPVQTQTYKLDAYMPEERNTHSALQQTGGYGNAFPQTQNAQTGAYMTQVYTEHSNKEPKQKIVGHKRGNSTGHMSNQQPNKEVASRPQDQRVTHDQTYRQHPAYQQGALQDSPSAQYVTQQSVTSHAFNPAQQQGSKIQSFPSVPGTPHSGQPHLIKRNSRTPQMHTSRQFEQSVPQLPQVNPEQHYEAPQVVQMQGTLAHMTTQQNTNASHDQSQVTHNPGLARTPNMATSTTPHHQYMMPVQSPRLYTEPTVQRTPMVQHTQVVSTTPMGQHASMVQQTPMIHNTPMGENATMAQQTPMMQNMVQNTPVPQVQHIPQQVIASNGYNYYPAYSMVQGYPGQFQYTPAQPTAPQNPQMYQQPAVNQSQVTPQGQMAPQNQITPQQVPGYAYAYPDQWQAYGANPVQIPQQAWPTQYTWQPQ